MRKACQVVTFLPTEMTLRDWKLSRLKRSFSTLCLVTRYIGQYETDPCQRCDYTVACRASVPQLVYNQLEVFDRSLE